jgi:hypothetical protein
MIIPPTHQFNDLGIQAQNMSKNCTNQRTAMIFQYVALGCMIAMTGVMAAQVLKEVFGSTNHDHSQGRSR